MLITMLCANCSFVYNSHTTLWDRYYDPHLTEEETDKERVCPGDTTCKAPSDDPNPDLSKLRPKF